MTPSLGYECSKQFNRSPLVGLFFFSEEKSQLPGFELGLYPFCFGFFSCLFFYESQALHRQICSGICYFSVTPLVLHIVMMIG